eukprot:4917038-Prymnesium_polylepis.1
MGEVGTHTNIGHAPLAPIMQVMIIAPPRSRCWAVASPYPKCATAQHRLRGGATIITLSEMRTVGATVCRVDQALGPHTTCAQFTRTRLRGASAPIFEGVSACCVA